jgi:hypothetical protein
LPIRATNSRSDTHSGKKENIRNEPAVRCVFNVRDIQLSGVIVENCEDQCRLDHTDAAGNLLKPPHLLSRPSLLHDFNNFPFRNGKFAVDLTCTMPPAIRPA